MKKLISVMAAAFLTAGISESSAQSAMDAYSMLGSQLRGSARFVAMGGAFTSLGGDLSCMTQNPAGLGIYRRSEVGLSFDVSIRNYQSKNETGMWKTNHTKAYFDNFGYVGTTRLNGALRTFNWGVGYSRLAEFDRRFHGYNMPTASSLSNYIASYTNGLNSSDMLFDSGYNPYLDSDADWLSILAYNSFMINNTGTSNTNYAGLYQSGTTGDAEYDVRESGYTDEYNIDFAGNISDLVYWGVGVGIVDMQYNKQINYSESMADALIYDGNGGNLTNGNAGFALYNQRYTSGTGANIKLGVILRPVDMLRIGFAVHTPTWMSLNSTGNADTKFNYTAGRYTKSGSEYTDDFDYNWKLNTPWHIMVGASAVLGRSAIVSVDYEHVAYQDSKVKYQSFGLWDDSYVSDDYVNDDIKSYFRASNILRVGLEYRITNSLSARAGYWFQSSNVRPAAADGDMDIATSGTDPSYSFNKTQQSISLGLGYRYRAWYIDLTYQLTRRESTFHAYTPYLDIVNTPQSAVTSKLNNIILATGFRF